MMKPLPSMHTYEHEEKRNQDKDQIVVYPDFFTSGDEPDEYIFIVAPDPGYGQVSFDLYDFNNLPRPTGYWANLGRCCKSSNCPDSRLGTWIGGQVSFEGASDPSSLTNDAIYGLWGRGTLVAAETFPSYNFKVTCSSDNPKGVYIGGGLSGIFCWDSKCIDDIEGESFGVGDAAGFGPYGSGASFDFGSESKCFGLDIPFAGLGFGGYVGERQCNLEIIR